jgi:hypothetical protein
LLTALAVLIEKFTAHQATRIIGDLLQEQSRFALFGGLGWRFIRPGQGGFILGLFL